MDAVLLAGGYGTRLRPLTYTRPKPLLPVAGKPMLEWALDALPDEVEKVVVAVNWQADALERYFERRMAERPDGPAFVVVREGEPLGTAGAVRNCAEHLKHRFFVLNGDIVSDMDLGAMARQMDETGGKGTIALKQVPGEEVSNYGVVAFDEEDPRRIRTFVEKPATVEEAPSRWINAGAYLLDRSVIDLIPEGRLVSMEKEIFPLLLDDGLYGHRHEGTWVDVGDPVRLRQAAHAMDAKTAHGKDAAIEQGATFVDSLAGDRLRMGKGARVEQCVLGDDVTIEAGASLFDCVVGDGEHVTGALEHERVWTREVPEAYPQKQVGNTLAAN